MSSLNIEYKGKKIPIAGIDIKSSNENVTFGSLERDLILKTLGKIYVQVGNKYYDLNFNLNGNNLSLNNIIAVKGMDKVNAKDYSNGTFLLETESSTLFLVYNNKLIELASGSGGSKLYLSYAEEQNLSGSQTHTLVYNAKLNIKSLDEISKFTYDDVYENQVIYVEDQKCHYVLDKYNVPNALTSWRPIYLTTMGGTLYDGLTIYNQSKNYTLALEGLHLEGDNIYKGLRIGTDENYIRTAATTEGIIKTEFNGTALVINRNNNTIFEYNNGNIGIGGKASRGEYNNILYGTSKLTGNLFTNYNIMSDDFQSRNITAWDGGQGYALKKTSIGTWFLEVDDLVVRNSISAEVLNLKELVVDRTYATGGHMMVTDGAKVSKVEYYPNITQENKEQVKHPLKETPINGTLDIGESYYFVYFNDQDKDVDEETGESEYDAGAFCPFIKGDILLCQSFTGLKTKKYYAIVSYSDNYRVAIKYKDFYGSYIIIDADRPSTDFDSLNSIDVKDELVRVGNEDPKRISRQKIIDIDGTRNWITMYDNLNSLKYAKDDNGDFIYDEEGRKIATDGPLTYDNLKLRIGNLAGLPDHGKGGTAVLPDDVGYGLFADNVYLKGKMVLWRVEDGVEYSEYLGINRGIWSPTAKYYVGDRVTYNGSYYYCAKVSDTGSNIGMNPEDYTDFWTLLVAKGSDGIPGQSVTYMNITGLSYFKVNTQDNPDPISITLTANLYNVDIDSLLKTIRYQWVCNSTIVKDITYSDAFDTHLTSTLDIPYRGTTTNPVGDVQKEINWTTIWANANYNTFICNVFINGTQITVDQFTIYKIKDGADGAPGESGKPGLTIIASNEALVIPSDYNGYINPNFIGANSQSSCSIDVFSGATKLIYSETETGSDKYKISISSTTPNLISTFFEKSNNTFYLIKGHYNSTSSTNPKLPDSFIVNVSVITNGVTYTKKVSYGLAKAGQDANLLDWIKEWTGNTTEIQSDGIITPKIYVGDPLTKTDNKYILKNGIYLGRGLNGGEPAQFVGYGGGFRTFELDTKGRFFLGKQITGATATSIPTYQDGGLSFDGNKLIIGNDSTIGGVGYTMGSLVNVVNEHKESISNIVGDSYVTSAEKFKLREIAARISQEYKDVETSLAGLLGITDVSTLPTNSVPFREYKTAYSKFLEDLNYYINANPDSDGFIPVVSGHNLNTSNNNYYNKLVTVRQEIENQRINRFNKNTANVLRQQTEPLTRGDGSPLQIGDIWISIDASGIDVFSKVVISTNPVVWRFLGDNTGTAIDKGLITTGTIKLTSKTNNQIDKAGITGSNSTIAYFNPSDLSDISITQDSTHSLSSAVRFWAGLTAANQTWNDAPFKVYENGAVFATAGKIGALGINGDNMHVGGSSPFNNIITTRPEPSLLRAKPGLTIKSNGDIVGQDYYLSGDASKRASVFIGDFYFVEQPSNSIYSQFTSVSAGLNALNQKFDSMFSLAFVNIHNGNVIDGSLPEGANPSDYMLQIKAKMSFFSVGGITAKGASASSGNFWKGLPIDPKTLAWDSNDRLTVVGGTGGGGDISLNGTLYKPVNGVITLPNLATPGDITTALNGYATQAWVTDKNYATQSWVNGKGYVTATALATMGFATQVWVNSQGFLKSASLDNYVTKDTAQNITGVKTFSSGLIATDIVANKFKTLSGTSSQFLKADGSVDSNLYALAYEGNQNKTQYSKYSRFTNYVQVIDRRSETPTPNSYESHNITAFFNASNGMPDGNWWSGFHVRGWGDGYCTWELIGPSSTNNVAYGLRYRTGIGDTWGAWRNIITEEYSDTRYVLKTGDTMTGRLTAPSFRASSIMSVGALSDAVTTRRAELHLITALDDPCDLWMGANNSRRWSITARGSGENYQLGIYNNTRSNWNVLFRDDINDFYVKTEVRSTFLVIPPNTTGDYNEGIRVCNGSNNWSNIQFGAQSAWNGKIDGQWIVGKNPAKNFQICIAGTETSGDDRPSRGFSVDRNGYLHTSYISTEVNPDNQGDYFYSSDDTFLRRSTWYAALSHLSNKQRILDLTSLDPNKWYPCFINAPAYGGTPLRITLFNGLRGNKPTWSSHQNGFSLLLDYEVIGSGWETLAAIAKLNWYFGGFGGETAFGGRQQNTMASEEIIYLRGGGIYYYRTTNGNAITAQPNGYAWSMGSYNYSAPVKTSQDNSPIVKTFDQVYWAPNNLRNTRTIWGQSFNGTQNVSGALSGATTITASGDITTSANIGGRSIYASADLTAAGYTYCNGRLYVDRGRFSATATPTISLAIGDTDTGFHWEADGVVSIYCNSAAHGDWRVGQFRYGHGYLKQASGNDYHTLGIMVNGNGTANTIKPGIGFHQPGVYANSLRSDGPGDFRFCVQGGTVGCTVQAANFYANGGWLYSSANGCEVRIGSQNSSYVHFTTNPARNFYFSNSLYVDGSIFPNATVYYDLGSSNNRWKSIYLENSFATGWYRSSGSSGWYSQDYGGGIHMTDTTYVRVYNNKSFYVSGNILATGGITAKSTSDIRLKIKVNNPISYKDRLMNLGMVFDYRFNNIAKSRKGKLTDDLNHIGLSYQKVRQTLPIVTGEDEDKYGYINYISPDLISLSIGAIQEIILEERKIKEDIIILKSKVRHLESENILLKKRLGLIP